MMKKISVIVPVRKKEEMLDKVVNTIPKYCEIIIVTTSEEYVKSLKNKEKNFKLVKIDSSNRSDLMNAGAKLAKGEVIFFIHPDTIVDKHVFSQLQQLPNETIGGGIDIKFDTQNIVLKIIAWGSNKIRMRLFHIIYGDQCIFVKHDVFEKLNGYKSIMIFEDFEFSSRLRKCGKLVFFSSAQTSARRFIKKGILKQMLLNWYLVILYYLGVSDKNLRKLYEK